MQPAIYVGLSAQLALEKRMETLARNVANMNTAGFRAEEVKFSTYLSKKGPDAVNFASAGRDLHQPDAGGVDKTGQSARRRGRGRRFPRHLRRRRARLYPRRAHEDVGRRANCRRCSNHPVLDAGGSPMLLDPEGGPPVIARDGMIWQGNQQVGALGLFAIDPNAKLQRYENSGVIPDKAGDTDPRFRHQRRPPGLCRRLQRQSRSAR
jgi:flagellar basal-body rod protein FlgF